MPPHALSESTPSPPVRASACGESVGDPPDDPSNLSPEPESPQERRPGQTAARLLDGLESLLQRNRALLVEPEVGELHVELIAAEVAHELAIARAALRHSPTSIDRPYQRGDTAPPQSPKRR